MRFPARPVGHAAAVVVVQLALAAELHLAGLCVPDDRQFVSGLLFWAQAVAVPGVAALGTWLLLRRRAASAVAVVAACCVPVAELIAMTAPPASTGIGVRRLAGYLAVVVVFVLAGRSPSRSR